MKKYTIAVSYRVLRTLRNQSDNFSSGPSYLSYLVVVGQSKTLPSFTMNGSWTQARSITRLPLNTKPTPQQWESGGVKSNFIIYIMYDSCNLKLVYSCTIMILWAKGKMDKQNIAIKVQITTPMVWRVNKLNWQIKFKNLMTQ